jgi:hypothetical protein
MAGFGVEWQERHGHWHVSPRLMVGYEYQIGQGLIQAWMGYGYGVHLSYAPLDRHHVQLSVEGVGRASIFSDFMGYRIGVALDEQEGEPIHLGLLFGMRVDYAPLLPDSAWCHQPLEGNATMCAPGSLSVNSITHPPWMIGTGFSAVLHRVRHEGWTVDMAGEIWGMLQRLPADRATCARSTGPCP